MLVTTGIDIYTVDSRILYCGFLAYRQKERNTKDAFKKKDSWVPNQNIMQKQNVAHLKTKCHL